MMISKKIFILISICLVTMGLFLPVSATINDYNQYLVLNMHMNQTAGQPTWFYDSSPSNKTITTGGNAYTDTSIFKLGNASGHFTNVTSDYLSLSDSVDWTLGSIWTASAWINMSVIPSGSHGYSIFSHSADGDHEVIFSINANNRLDMLAYQPSSYTTHVSGTTAFSANTWYHVAVIQSASGTTKLYVNGIEESYTLTTSDSIPDNTGILEIGRESTTNGVSGYFGRGFVGSIDELSIWKGVAIPISQLYPQTAELNTTQFTPFEAYGDSWRSTNKSHTVIKWNQTGNHHWVTIGNSTTFNYVIQAGGGGGGMGGGGVGAGGAGAGGHLSGNYTTNSDTLLDITVGEKGIHSTSDNDYGTYGGNSTISGGMFTLSAMGGAPSKAYGSPGLNGGSGSGTYSTAQPGVGILGQGNRGANSTGSSCGGGGGAGSVGSAGASVGGAGGSGVITYITGTAITLGGGGGGGSGVSSGGAGGSGGGGNGGANLANGSNGVNETGGGGGGAGGGSPIYGGDGGSGVVIISYVTDSYVEPPTVIPLTSYSGNQSFTYQLPASAGSQTDYQVKFILSNSTGVSGYYAPDNIIYTNGSTRVDWFDVNATDGSGNPLPFWLENNTYTAKNATAWVKVPAISTANTSTGRWYFGNSTQTVSTMDGLNTFPLWDDWGTISSINASKWISSGSGSEMVTSNAIAISGGTNAWRFVSSNGVYGYNTSVRSRSLVNQDNTAGWGIGISDNGGNNQVNIVTDSTPSKLYQTWVGGTATSNVIRTSTLTSYTVIESIRTPNCAKFYENGVLKGTLTTNVPTSSYNVTMQAKNVGTTLSTNWIFVRKSTTTEPIISFAGSSPVTQEPIFAYNKTLSISGSSSALTNYPVMIKFLNTTGTDSANGIFLGNNVNANWSDIRFTNSTETEANATNTFAYWIESRTGNATNNSVWIKIPSIPTTGTSFKVWYGNASAASMSWGNVTFPDFDDFDSTLNTTKWADLGGNSISNSIITSTGTNDFKGIISKVAYGYNTSFRSLSKMTLSNIGGATQWVGFANPARTKLIILLTDSPTANYYATRTYDGSSVSTIVGQSEYSGYNIIDIARNALTNARFTINSNLTAVHTSQLPSDALNLTSEAWSNGQTTSTDWVLVRPYSYPEPLLTGFSTPTVSNFTANTTAANVPAYITFTDTTTNTPTEWNWSFGDGTWQNGTTQNATKWYNTTGLYTVKLLTSNAGGSNLTTKTNYLSIGSNLTTYSAQNVLLLHMNQTVGQPTWFYDSSASNKTVTPGGNVITSTSSKVLGNASGYFDGTTDYLTIPTSTDFNFGNGDFTISFTYNPSSTTNFDTWVERDDGTTNNLFKIDIGDGSYKPRFVSVASGITIANYQSTDAQTFTTGTWYHMVYERNSSGIYLWKNGVNVPLSAGTAIGSTSLPTMTSALTIGRDLNNAGRDINGYIDELSIWKGVAIPIQELYPQPVEITLTGPDVITPVSTFTTNVTSGYTPLTVQFNDTSNNTPTSWSWNATNVTGNNTPFTFSTVQNASHTFTTGNYSIKLNVTNSAGSNISTQVTWVNVSRNPMDFGDWVAYGDSWKRTNATHTVIMWNQTGSHSWLPIGNASNVSYLVVAGGGGAGDGGGGAGGVVLGNLSVNSSSVPILVGNGGINGYTSTGGNGQNSTLFNIIAIGGGGGGYRNHQGGLNGGSGGGGGSYNYITGGSATQPSSYSGGYGNAGGNGVVNNYGSGGGGGAITSGGTGSGTTCGNGGSGIGSLISGSLIYYGGGGGGGAYTGTIGTGGIGGGGNGVLNGVGYNGTNGLGGGGGGSALDGGFSNGGFGGSGVVIISYVTDSYVPPAPTSSFTANTTGANTPALISFTDSSSESPTSWYWEFGDGTTSTSQNPTHWYNTTGRYSVNLSATNAYGSDWENKSLYLSIGSNLSTYSSYNVLLMHMNQTAGQPTWFNDSSTNKLVVNAGTVSYNLTNKMFGNASSQHPGGGHDYLALAESPDWDFGTGDWTISYWEYVTNRDANNKYILNWYQDGSNRGGVYDSTTGQVGIALSVGGVSKVNIVTTSTVPLNTWTKISIVKQGTGANPIKIYINDNLTSLTTTTDLGGSAFDTSGLLRIGVMSIYTDYTSCFKGNIEELSIWKGVAIPINELYPQPVEITLTGPGVIIPVSTFTANVTSGDTPLSVQFNDTSINSPTSWSWNATNVTGNNTPFTFSTVQNASHTFTTGNYSISLNSTNSAGSNISTQITWVNVSALPIPTSSFTANTTGANTPALISFTDSSSESPTSWYWEFGDGTTSTSQNPTHWYNTTGRYSVNLSATNAYGSDWENKSLYLSIGSNLSSYSSYNVLLMHMNGTESAQIFNWSNATSNGDAIVYGSTKTNISIKYLGSASAYFDGTSDRLAINSSILPNVKVGTSNFTYSFWYNPTTLTSYDNFFKYHDNENIDNNYYKGDIGVVSGSTIKPRFYAVTGGTTRAGYETTSAITVTPSTWHQFVFQRNGSSLVIYFDGVSLPLTTTTAISTNSIGNFEGQFNIGMDTYNTGRDINGYIDELGFWNTVIPITELYPQPVEITLTGPDVITPVSTFTANVTSGYTPLTVQFNDTSNNTPTSWSWNATNVTGNNTPFTFSTVQNASHTFTTGNYSISLTSTNSAGSNISTQVTWVNVSLLVIPPTSTFTANITSGYSPLAVQFNDTSINSPTSWSWDARNVTGNNTPFTFSTVQNASHIFTIGNYSIKLNTTNSAGSNISTQITWINTTRNPMDFGDWVSYGDSWKSVNQSHTVIKWNQTGDHSWFAPGNASTMRVLVVGGGGGGALGGGGAGAYNDNLSYNITSDLVSVIVGSGGLVGTSFPDGNASLFGSIVMPGGGAGALTMHYNGSDGGSGGGGSNYGGLSTAPSYADGHAGGTGSYEGVQTGGGGGASEVGHNYHSDYGGDGGDGKYSDITGSLTPYAGGGGGASYDWVANPVYGGVGGGGNGGKETINPEPGVNGTGGGAGGAGGATTKQLGGSGIVIIQYLTDSYVDTIPPISITGLFNDSVNSTSISWSWNKPQPLNDFDHIQVYRNNVFLYNNTGIVDTWTGLTPATSYEIATHSVDTTGNVNSTWVNSTAVTHNATPVSSFTSNATFGYLPSATIQFTDTSSNTPTNWTWSYTTLTNPTPVNFSVIRNPAFDFTTIGNYSIKLIAENDGGYNISTQTTWVNISIGFPFTNFVAYGDSWKSVNQSHTVIKWNQTGDHSWFAPGNASTMRVLVIGGGGGGSYGGGGAGAYNDNISYTIQSTNIVISVGIGGTYGTAFANGNSSSFDTIVMPGGGSGGGSSTSAGVAGGSGGGGNNAPGGLSTAPSYADGHAGGESDNFGTSGGGGGASEVGYPTYNPAYGGSGGNGKYSDITGTLTPYAGGGGGNGLSEGAPGGGGIGGGGAGSVSSNNPEPGVPGTGSGSGGGSNIATPQPGGSGVVIIQYLTDSYVDVIPPLSITGLSNTTSTSPTSINWFWNPTDADVDHVQIYKNNVFFHDSYVFSDLWTGLTPNTPYEIATHTVDMNGNVNHTWVNRTISTPPLPPVVTFTVTSTSGEIPLNVMFTDHSTNSPTSWEWDFGDGDYDQHNWQNPMHTYSSLGTYTVRLNASNAGGTGTATYVDYITVHAVPPVAEFTSDKVEILVADHIQFTDLTTNIPVSWHWDFGDNDTTDHTLQNPSHTYLTPGSYTVSLTSTNSGGTSTETKVNYISVVEAPVARFNVIPTTGLKPYITVIDQSLNTPTTWSWDFGDGTTSFLQNTVHTYDTVGTYTVTLTVSNIHSSDTIVQAVVIPPYYYDPVYSNNWTYDLNTTGYDVDVVNSTYMKDWMYYLIVTNSSDPWDFPVIGFAGSIMGPFTHAFSGIGDGSGNIVFLILFGLFVMMVWRQSGKVTIPAMISVIIGSGWMMLMPESATPYAQILLSVALASQVLTWFARD